MKVKVKIISDGNIGWFDFWGGIEKWVYGRSVEIAREPELAEYADDAEREQGLRIVKGIFDRMSENAKTAYGFKKKELDDLEEQTLSIAQTILRSRAGKMLNHELIEHLAKIYPEHKEDTLRRRLDSLYEKERLDKEKRGKNVFYALTASDRIKESIPA